MSGGSWHVNPGMCELWEDLGLRTVGKKVSETLSPKSWAWWQISIISPMWEKEVGRLLFKVCPREKC
jgi:hypothetical protein